MPGSENLMKDARVLDLVQQIYGGGGYAAAICAAPIVLGRAGLLEGKRMTCYPGFEKQLTGASYTGEPVTVDGTIITGKGPGCAIPFALKLVEIFTGHDSAVSLSQGMQVYWMQQ
jgi:4-methyl-5(b-hydroxyethyl)-thiazole monophosphate biosynthesis